MMEYQITTGDLAFRQHVPMSGRVFMRDPVDGDSLRHALELTVRRLPFVRAAVVEHDGRLWLRENDLPFNVVEGLAPLPPDDPCTNGYAFGFAFHDNQILFRYDHIVCDGHGFAGILHTLLSYYCMLRYETPGPDLTVDCSDPYGYAERPERQIPAFQVPDAFVPSPDELLPNGSSREYLLQIPRDELLCTVKRLSGSPSTLMALLLSRSIKAVYPEASRPVVTRIAADVRNALGCPSTIQNCLTSLFFNYSNTVAKMPLDLQMTCFRGMLLRQTESEYIHQTISDNQKLYERLVASRLCGQEVRPDVNGITSLLTYIGDVGHGELDQYCGQVAMDPGIWVVPFNLAMMDNDGVFSVSIASRTKRDDVYEAFLGELNTLDIPYKQS